MDDFIGTAKQLAELGIVPTLMVIVGVLGYYIFTEDKYKKETAERDRERTDTLIDLVSELKSELKSQQEFEREQTTFIRSLVDNHIEHYREANMKCKDELSASMSRIEANIADIKMCVLKG